MRVNILASLYRDEDKDTTVLTTPWPYRRGLEFFREHTKWNFVLMTVSEFNRGLWSEGFAKHYPEGPEGDIFPGLLAGRWVLLLSENGETVDESVSWVNVVHSAEEAIQRAGENTLWVVGDDKFLSTFIPYASGYYLPHMDLGDRMRSQPTTPVFVRSRTRA